MGGGILKMLAEGLKVGVLDLTSGEPTPHGSLEIRAAETQAATDVLKLSWRGNLGLTNRSLEPTLAARKELASVIRLTRPRWLFAPYWTDAHPDHTAATQLVDAARFWAKLSKEFWEQKQEAISCFQSQFVTGREQMDPSFLDQLKIEAAYWGKTIGVKYGEPYNSREPIGLSGFEKLI